MNQTSIQGGGDLRAHAHAAASALQRSERDAQRLSLLNALLMISLEDLPLERQLLCVLDLLLTLPWFPMKPKAVIFLVGNDPTMLEMSACRGLPDELCAQCASVPFGYCVCGYAAASKQIVFTNTVDDLHQIRYPGMQGHGHYSVPLCQADRVLGVLTLYLEEGHRQAPEEVEFLNMFASALVGMIARNQATERVQRLLAEKRQLNQRLIALQEQEYRHLARELHDEIGQSVAAIKTEAALLPQQSGNELQRGIQAISSVADHIYETMHAMVRRLRPGTLDDLGLLAAIEAQVNEWKRQRPTLACSLDSHGRFDDLDDTTTITIYRFVQECLTNIVRHAAATEVKISLKRIIGAAGGSERGSVEICVSDNGRGADLARMQERGGRFGLLGMRERVEGLGGTLVIEGGPGRGLKLCARIPVLERRKG